MKIFLAIVAGVVLFIAIAVGAIFYMTSGLTGTATAFFDDIKAEKYSAAYNYLSKDFKADTTQAQLKTFLGKHDLLHFKDTSWGAREVSIANRGSLKGSVLTDAGNSVPIQLSFVKEKGAWKIFSIKTAQAGGDASAQSEKLPSNEELVSLTDESMRTFAEAVNAKNFANFRAYVSHLWQSQYSVEKFNKIFKPFIDAKINMLPALRSSTPQFDNKPSINENGLLEIDGHYPTSPSRIYFKLKYIYEGLDWKLAGIYVNIK